MKVLIKTINRMKLKFRFKKNESVFFRLKLLPVFFIFCSSQGMDTDDFMVVEPPEATILKVTPVNLSARPREGFRINYRWKDVSLNHDDYQVKVYFVDSEGETLFKDNHKPQIPTSEWTGDIEYTHTLSLPVWEIVDNKTISAVLPEGKYSVQAGLYNEKTEEMVKLGMGPDVTQVEKGLYEIGVLILDDLAPLPDLGEPTLNLTGYEETFVEDFNTLRISAHGPIEEGGARWIAHTPWGGDFGDARFMDPFPGFPFSVEDGILRIEARKEAGEWQSGLLSAVDSEGNGFSQQYGYFECRAKFPYGPGVWAAFWLMGTKNLNLAENEGPRINPEVDIVEHYGHWPNRFSYVLHQWGFDGIEGSHIADKITVFDVQEDFHTYGALINEDYIVLYFDGVEMRRMKTPDGFKTPLYPLVNLALGPGWPLDKTPDPSYMYVDYIKVYNKESKEQ